jgi:DNA-binding FrmR family transcriptional regulator
VRLRLAPEVRDDLLRRMRRIEGQARGVQGMIESARDCEEVVQQLTAMRAALAKVAMTVVAENLEECLLAKDGGGGEDEARERAVRRAKEVFLRLA